ncbi:hypothetical protein [Rhizobium sp. ZPR3]|uniref:DUF2282 domain-containing protein n=2 Tax=unclassified Rhizobium TaxID=2613769 RepID=A0AAU7SPP2_9HYPH
MSIITTLLVAGAAPTTQAASPVLQLKETKFDGCKKFTTRAGKTWKAAGKIVVQGASCPADFKGKPTIRGEMLDAHSVKLANGSICRFDDTGKGHCS